MENCRTAQAQPGGARKNQAQHLIVLLFLFTSLLLLKGPIHSGLLFDPFL
jgi:hypothetical protein